MSTLRPIRGVLGLALPAMWALATLAPFVWFWDRLPDPMASHWGLSGAPDGSLPKLVFFVVLTVPALASATAAWVLSQRAPTGPGEVAPGLSTATFVGVLFALLSGSAVSLNLDVPSWREAKPMSLVAIALTTTIPMVAAATVQTWARRLEIGPDWRRFAPRPTVGLKPGERAVWTGTASSLLMVITSLALIGFAPAAALMTQWKFAVPIALAAFLIVGFVRVSVRVDHSGLFVRLGLLGIPRIRIPIERIVGASRIQVMPLAHGGWGYRGSLRLLGRAAVVIRQGEGLQVELVDGKTFVVTVDDADTGAGLLNDILRSRARQP